MKISPDKARSIADAIDAYDEDIAALQEGKRATFASLREELEAEGLDRAEVKAEIAALKAAITIRAKRRKDDTAEDREALTETYLEALAGVARGARTRERANETAGSAAQLPGNAAFTSPGVQPAEHEHVERGASARPHNAEGEPAIPSKPGDAGRGQASAKATGTTEQPSGAGTGSAVRTGAPIIAKPYDPGPIPAFLDRRVRA